MRLLLDSMQPRLEGSPLFMARRRFVCWFVLVLYVLLGGLEAFHAVEDATARHCHCQPSWTSGPALACAGGCNNPTHHHHDRSGHDHQTCPICHAVYLPALEGRRAPGLEALELESRPGSSTGCQSPRGEFSTTFAARAPPGNV